jgi:hypothetical protein
VKVARRLAASVLTFEALVVCFAIAVAIQVSDVRPALALPVGLALALACLLTCGLLRSRVGYAVGSVLQVVVMAAGFVVPAMFVLGALFAGLWVTAVVLGRRIAEAEAARAPAAGPTG